MTALDKALPQFLGAMLDCLPPKEREGVEELRLREGFPLSAVQAGEEWTHPAWAEPPPHRGGPPPGGGDGRGGARYTPF